MTTTKSSSLHRPVLALVTVTALVGALLLALGNIPPGPSSVSAATLIVVTTSTDEVANNAVCSLREAILFANGNQIEDACGPDNLGPYTIVLEDDEEYVLTLGSAGEDAAAEGDLDLFVGVAVTVRVDPFGGNATIDGNDNDRVFHLLHADSSLSLFGITVRDGNTTAGPGTTEGGGIYSTGGDISLTASTVTSNDAGNSGGGIRIGQGQLTLLRSDVTDNTSAFNGGGIFGTDGAAITLTESSVTGNDAGNVGGGIRHVTSLIVTDSLISNNRADSNGGGIYSLGNTTLTDSTVSLNTADDDGDFDGDGGGIHSGNADSATITGSTISNNNAINGGGISNGGTLVLTDSLVDANNSRANGAGIYSAGDGDATPATADVTLNNSTVSDNMGHYRKRQRGRDLRKRQPGHAPSEQRPGQRSRGGNQQRQRRWHLRD